MTVVVRGGNTILLFVFVVCFTLCYRETKGRIVPATAETDNSAPAVGITADSCFRSFTVTFTDSLPEDSGIKGIRIREQVNCSITLDTSRLPDLVRAIVTTTDPQLDAVYALEAADKSNNVRYVRDTLQGFTLRFRPVRTSLTYPDVVLTQHLCDSIRLYNTGLLPYTLTGVQLASNTFFSAPLSQFPLTLAPGDSAAVQVCFSPTEDTSYNDTLIVRQHCQSIALPLYGRGVAVPIDTFSDARCGIRIHLDNSKSGLLRTALYPNPANDRATLRFVAVNPCILALRIIDNMGCSVMELPSAHYTAGTYTIELDIAHLQTGLYFCELLGDVPRTVLPLWIVH